MMNSSIAVKGKDFVVMAADASVQRSILVLSHNDNKLYPVGERTMLAVTGEDGDTVQFAELIEKNLQLYKMRHGYELGVGAAAHYVRRWLADAIRSSPYVAQVLLAGVEVPGAAATPDAPAPPAAHLYWIDYLGSKVDMDFAAHGYGSFFSMSTMDRHYKPDLSVDNAVALITRCIAEIEQRFLVKLPKFLVRVVDADGVRPLPDIISHTAAGAVMLGAGAVAGAVTPGASATDAMDTTATITA